MSGSRPTATKHFIPENEHVRSVMFLGHARWLLVTVAVGLRVLPIVPLGFTTFHIPAKRQEEVTPTKTCLLKTAETVCVAVIVHDIPTAWPDPVPKQEQISLWPTSVVFGATLPSSAQMRHGGLDVCTSLLFNIQETSIPGTPISARDSGHPPLRTWRRSGGDLPRSTLRGAQLA